MRNLTLSLLFVVLLPLAVFSQNPAKWSLEVHPLEVMPSNSNTKAPDGTTYDVKLHAIIESGWHLYALEQPPGGPVATTINLAKDSPFEIAGPIKARNPKKAVDQNFIVDGKPLATLYYVDNVDFSFPIKTLEDDADSKIKID